MKRLEHDLLTRKYTEVFHEEEFTNNAPHHFEVYANTGIVMYNPNNVENDNPLPLKVGEVNFQEGPIQEAGINGVMNEDLIAMVICRLEHFNQTDFRCRENSMAITKLEAALLWLRKRTVGREKRGVEGTHTK